MKKIISIILLVSTLFACTDDFLDNPPATGLSEDKLVDLPAMRALIYGAYDASRDLVAQSSLYGAAMVRDVLVRNNPNYSQFFDHQLSTNMTSWMYDRGYRILGLVNTVAVSNIQEMEGSDAEKNAILGDMHFLRALVYFDLNNYFELPSTGYSLPLVLEPIGVNDRVSCSLTEDVRNAIETDIEQAREYFKDVSGVADYYAATALSARIYFFHKKYDLAYQRANEVVESGMYAVEGSVKAAYTPNMSSLENIFTIKYNAADGSGRSPVNVVFEAYQASETKGFYIMNDASEAGQFLNENVWDSRYGNFCKVKDGVTYYSGKYSSDQMDYVLVRLPEMLLTRAESNIMNSNSVSQQDVDDINAIRTRGDGFWFINSIPSKAEALDYLYYERTKELAYELGDHYLNARRLERGIIKTAQEGNGLKSYSEYSDMLVFPFPDIEVKIHNLTRRP